MWNTPTKAELVKIPKLYSTKKTPPKNIMIYMRLMLTWGLSKKGLDSVKTKQSHLEMCEIKEMINESQSLGIPKIV